MSWGLWQSHRVWSLPHAALVLSLWQVFPISYNSNNALTSLALRRASRMLLLSQGSLFPQMDLSVTSIAVSPVIGDTTITWYLLCYPKPLRQSSKGKKDRLCLGLENLQCLGEPQPPAPPALLSLQDLESGCVADAAENLEHLSDPPTKLSNILLHTWPLP